MLGRRRIDTPAPLRSSIADAAFAVEERVVWGGADALRRIGEAIKWPFERVIWAIERGFVWPLEERTGDWGASVRVLGFVVLALLAAGAGVLGLVWASGSGGTSSVQRAAAPVAPPIVRETPQPAPGAAAPALQGAKPDFTAEAETGVSKSAGANASASAASGSTAEIAKSASAANGSTAGAVAAKPVGPAATKVARQFAAAFVLFETGRKTPAVRAAFTETATPQLTRELLQRPPRLPAGVEVPKAKVLNVVAGPQRGDTYALSVSLLRVGVTSELRLDMQLDPKTSEWRVTDVRG